MSKVSIIVPLYNLAKYLPDTVKSVIRQDYGFNNIELILVDDNSTDDSFEIAQSFAKKYDNVIAMITEKQSGSASMPRNIGLERATGDYIMFLDSDDMLLPNAVSTLVELMENNDADLADGAYEEIVGKSRKGIDRRYINAREGIYDLKNDIDEWFPMAHPIFTKLFKASIIRENRIVFESSLINGEDSLFLFKYMANADKAVHSNTVIHEYRHRDDSVSHDFANGYYMNFIHTYDIMSERLVTDTGRLYFHYFIRYTLFPNLDILCDRTEASREYTDHIIKEYF